jgi:hypothetical protein
MATGVEKVSVELVLKKLSDGIAKTTTTLHHSHLGLSSGNLLIVISLDGLIFESLHPNLILDIVSDIVTSFFVYAAAAFCFYSSATIFLF